LNGEYKKSKEMKNVQHKITKLNFGGYLTPYYKAIDPIVVIINFAMPIITLKLLVSEEESL
jgi:hypothetical protein